MKRLITVIGVLCLALETGAALGGGRYDQQILAGTQKIIADNSDYKNVHADVEDSIVTLTGTVKLESTRLALEDRVRHLANVGGVRNQVVLDPPVALDQVLFTRLNARLIDAGYEHIGLKVHNGEVILTGAVRTQQERSDVLQIVWATEGVREVQAQLTILQ
jgi:osmotically-inducible protein OsmY